MSVNQLNPVKVCTACLQESHLLLIYIYRVYV